MYTSSLLDQSTQVIPSLLTRDGDFIHLCVFGKGRLGDEDVLDLVLDAEVQL